MKLSQKILLISIIIFVLIEIIIFFKLDSLMGKVYFKNIDKITISLNEEYKESNIEALYCKYRKCQDVSNKITISGKVDNTKIGTYLITYEVIINNNHYNKIRKVVVKDTTPPFMELNGEDTIYLKKDTSYQELGCSAIDIYDGNITNKIQITDNLNINKLGEYLITYKVQDNSGNKSSIDRKVVVLDIDKNGAETYIKELEEYIKENKYRVSLAYYNFEKNYEYKYNDSVTYYGASLIKTLDAMYIYENNLLTEKNKNNVKKAITVSNNRAHFNLVDTIGFNNLKKYGISLGAQYTLVGKDNYGVTNVTDQLIYWKHLYYLINNLDSGEELKSYFINENENYLLFDSSPIIMHKYGETSPVFHDVGIVLDNSPYIIVILTNEFNHNYKKIIADLSARIYQLHQYIK